MKLTRIVVIAAALLVTTDARTESPAPTMHATTFPPMHHQVREPIDPQRLGNSDYCGHCHTDIFHQWNASAHHFASFNNPVYRRVALDAAERRGGNVLQFCARCHDPLPLLSGKSVSSSADLWASNAGITCLACHRITEIHGTNGEYTVKAPFLHPFALTEKPWQQRMHQWLLRLTPGLHRAVLSKDFYGAPEYCATCHTVVSPAALNGHQDLVLQDEHAQWQRSHYSAKSASGKTCVDCHMPLVPSQDPAAKQGYIRSHRFLGGNTLLPALNRDADQLRATQQFLKSSVVGLRCSASRDGEASQPCSELQVATGDRVRLHIEVVNRGVGHNFPAGTSDSNEAWLEIRASSADGQQLLHSGGRDALGNVEPAAHFLRKVYLDKGGKPVDRRRAATDAASVGSNSVIPAGGVRAATYEIEIPAQARLPITVDTQLNWRKFPQSFVDWVFEGRDAPQAPVTVMSELRVELGKAKVAQVPSARK